MGLDLSALSRENQMSQTYSDVEVELVDESPDRGVGSVLGEQLPGEVLGGH